MRNYRFYWVVLRSLPYAAYMIPRAEYMAKHPKKYNSQDCFDYACKIFERIRKLSKTTTKVIGKENIPKEDGCIFYSNHEGKYDAVGILKEMDRPCSVLWEKKQSQKMLARQVCDLLDGVTIDLEDMRDKVNSILEVTNEVKAGRNFLIFPEGGYTDEKQNSLGEFKSGCFTCAVRSQSTIVPVTIWDSYKPLNRETFEPVETQIHFLQPIHYEEYQDMTKIQLAELVKGKIADRLELIEAGNYV